MKYSLAIIFIVYLFTFFNNKNWEKEIIGGGDAWGYYVYLPALFIHKDISNLETSYRTRLKYNKGSWIADNTITTEAYSAANGNKVIKYTIGMALLESPLFVTAHLVAYLFDYPQDGCSFPYMFIVNLGLLLYTFIGLYYLKKWLILYYNDSNVSLLLFTVALATNLYYFANTAMAHSILFSLYCILLYCTDLFYRKYSYKYAFGIGFAMGFIILIRPVELLCIFIPIFYNIFQNKEFYPQTNSFIIRLKLFAIHYKKLLLAALITILIGSVQLIYWKSISGQWVFYSYGKESFDFKNPHIYEGLFSFQNGWLVYTPIMSGILLGIFFYKNRLLRYNYIWIILIIITHIYITYSWWCWQYINGLGSRPMVDIYAVALIPLAALLIYLYNKIRIITITVIAFFSILNLFQTYQQHRGLMFAEAATAQFYKQMLFKNYMTYNDVVAYDLNEAQPENKAFQNIKTIANLAIQAQKIAPTQFSENLIVANVNYETINNSHWLKISCKALKNYEGADIYRMSNLVLEIKEEGKEKPIIWKAIRIDNKIADTAEFSLWGGKKNISAWVHFYYQLDIKLNDNYQLKTYVWNNSPFEIQIDSLLIQTVN